MVSGPIAGKGMLPIDYRALHRLAGICHVRVKARWTWAGMPLDATAADAPTVSL